MKEEEKLLNLNIQKEQEKQSINHPEGIKLYFFRCLYNIFKNDGLNRFCIILFTILQFIQLIAFPMDKIFSSGWKQYWYETIGSFFRFFQLIYLWHGNSQFFLITYILSCLYILILFILFIHALARSSSLSYKSKPLFRIISLLLEFEIILNIPLLRTLISVFHCTNDNLEIAPNIECYTNIHIGLIIISVVLIFIFEVLMILFRATLYEFGKCHTKFKAAYSSSTEILLIIVKFIMIVLYQFITNGLFLSIITFLLSLILLIYFLNKQPYSNSNAMKLYFILYFIFFWSTLVCIIAILLKDSKFEGGILLLLIGFPLITLTISFSELELSFDKIFEFVNLVEKDSSKALLEIEYFLKLEESLQDKIKTKEQKILFSYISNYEKNCIDNNCALKRFLKIPLKVENFIELKICLLEHGEILYKNAVSKFPFNAKLRLSYGLFLYNKLHKKLKGTNEITLLNKYDTNLEDSFLIYKAQRFIQEKNEEETNNSNYSDNEGKSSIVNSITYKHILNNVKSLIGKITNNYIEFWAILTISDGNKSLYFQRMSKIGAKISILNEELIRNIKKLEFINLYDQDTFKLYIQYLIEILCNHNRANKYINKLSENDQKKHLYNEDNLFELNYKAMSKSEDYKYIVLNCSPSNFDTICNCSLSVCHIFGYSKDELIGHLYDYLLPELFSIHHRNLLKNKVEDFEKILLIKKSKKRSSSWDENSFIKNKMKYLVPIKIRWTLVSSEEEIIYAIGKIIIDNKTPIELEQEVIYILTDRNLIIQSFTSNAPKMLYLHSTAINNNLDITEYIKEFNEDYISSIEDFDNIVESSISMNENDTKKKLKYIKTEILKRMFLNENDSKKVIHWKLSEHFSNDIARNRKNSLFRKRTSMARIHINDIKFQSAFNIDNSPNIRNPRPNVLPKKKKSSGKIQKIENGTHSNKKLYSSYTEEKLPNIDHEKTMELKDTNISDLIQDDTSISNEKSLKDKVYYHRQIHHKFILSVKEAKFNETRVGFIFRFEPYISKKIEETNITKNNQYISKYDFSSINKPETTEIEKSEISIMSFAANKPSLEPRNSFAIASQDNPFGIGSENNDIFFKKINNEKKNEFTIELKTMSYKQIGNSDKPLEHDLYELLRKEAVEKISIVARSVKNEDASDEEEESSSGSYTSGEDTSKNTSEISSTNKNNEQSSHHSKKDEQQIKSPQKNENNSNNEKKKISIKGSNNHLVNPSVSSKNNNINLSPLNHINNNVSNRHKEEGYYHVDVSKITYYIYNYVTGFVEAIKDQKYKISQVIKQINAEKEKLSKINSKYITNPKLAKEKKRGNANKKMADNLDELNSHEEQTMKLKEIQKALTSKEKQTSIIYLCIFSFIIFALFIGTGVMSIMINNYLKADTYMFYNLIKCAIKYYKNNLLEITFVREMIIINSPYYNNNFFDNDKVHYYKDYQNKCYQYYKDSASIVATLTTTINTLNERQKNLLTNKNVECFVLKTLKENETQYSPRPYFVKVFSGFRELNSALYHISQIEMDKMYTYNENVYYFIKNGMSNLLISSENLLKTLTEEFYNVVKKGYNIIYICLASLFVVYIACYLIFIHFYKKVEERKQSYLSVFYEIGGNFVVLSLEKCEKFSQKLQLQEANIGNQGDKISLDSSSFEDSDLDAEMQASPSLIKQNKENKLTSKNKEKQSKNYIYIKAQIIGFILFLILLAWQYSSYIYYYIRLLKYRNCAQYIYHFTDYISGFLFPFIGIREYIYEKQKYFYNTPVYQYIDETLHGFYTQLAETSDNCQKYVSHFPSSFSAYINKLYTTEICNFITDFINEFQGNGFDTCEDFFYGTYDYGFFSILTTYIEEIRMLKNTVNDYYAKAEQKNYIYNESFLNDPNGFYNILYDRFNNVSQDYNNSNPVNTLHYRSHKTIFIVYRFVILKIVNLALTELFNTFEGIFELTTKIGLIINITFIGVVCIGFFLLWLPFVFSENETIFKTKNMLSIIPNEILISLPHINSMLGIEEEKN